MGRFKFTYINKFKIEDAGIMLNIIPKFQYRNNINFREVQLHILGFLFDFIVYKINKGLVQFKSDIREGVPYRLGTNNQVNDIIYRIRIKNINNRETEELIKQNNLLSNYNSKDKQTSLNEIIEYCTLKELNEI